MGVYAAIGSETGLLSRKPQLSQACKGFPAALVVNADTVVCLRRRRRSRELGLKAQADIASSVLEGLQVAIDGDLRTLQEECGGIFAVCPRSHCLTWLRVASCGAVCSWTLQLAVCVHRTTAQCVLMAMNRTWLQRSPAVRQFLAMFAEPPSLGVVLPPVSLAYLQQRQARSWWTGATGGACESAAPTGSSSCTGSPRPTS